MERRQASEPHSPGLNSNSASRRLNPLSPSFPLCEMGCQPHLAGFLYMAQPSHCRRSVISTSFTVMQAVPGPATEARPAQRLSARPVPHRVSLRTAVRDIAQQRNTLSNECSSKVKGTKPRLGITKQSVIPWARNAFPAASTKKVYG